MGPANIIILAPSPVFHHAIMLFINMLFDKPLLPLLPILLAHW